MVTGEGFLNFDSEAGVNVSNASPKPSLPGFGSSSSSGTETSQASQGSPQPPASMSSSFSVAQQHPQAMLMTPAAATTP
ncbi:unnamed protein product, partial [Ectocarpus fasciculatus]